MINIIFNSRLFMRLSFMDYLKSKQFLHEHINTSLPVQTLRYQVTKYCKICLNEDGNKTTVKLKPNQNITIKWQYQDDEHRTPLFVSFDEALTETIVEDTEYEIDPTNKKFSKWIVTNTKVTQ